MMAFNSLNEAINENVDDQRAMHEIKINMVQIKDCISSEYHPYFRLGNALKMAKQKEIEDVDQEKNRE